MAKDDGSRVVSKSDVRARARVCVILGYMDITFTQQISSGFLNKQSPSIVKGLFL